jgi:hypothetical protein
MLIQIKNINKTNNNYKKSKNFKIINHVNNYNNNNKILTNSSNNGLKIIYNKSHFKIKTHHPNNNSSSSSLFPIPIMVRGSLKCFLIIILIKTLIYYLIK